MIMMLKFGEIEITYRAAVLGTLHSDMPPKVEFSSLSSSCSGMDSEVIKSLSRSFKEVRSRTVADLIELIIFLTVEIYGTRKRITEKSLQQQRNILYERYKGTYRLNVQPVPISYSSAEAHILLHNRLIVGAKFQNISAQGEEQPLLHARGHSVLLRE